MLEIESREWKNHLLFRDYLRANPASALAYARLKQNLATQLADDCEAYQYGKETFTQTVIQNARRQGF
jgi:GrpB-like predicted nucleotidyltransferase (UPF0157 family)